MQRLISLFKEPQEPHGLARPLELPKPSSNCNGCGNPEPLYFVQLLEYLRQRREAVEAENRKREAVEQN